MTPTQAAANDKDWARAARLAADRKPDYFIEALRARPMTPTPEQIDLVEELLQAQIDYERCGPHNLKSYREDFNAKKAKVLAALTAAAEVNENRWREALVNYITLVVDEEGVTFLHGGALAPLTQEETDAVVEIAGKDRKP